MRSSAAAMSGGLKQTTLAFCRPRKRAKPEPEGEGESRAAAEAEPSGSHGDGAFLTVLRTRRPGAARRLCKSGQELEVVRDEANEKDPLAIKFVTSDGQEVGYVPLMAAEKLAGALDSGSWEASATVLTGGDGETVHVMVRFRRPGGEAPTETQAAELEAILESAREAQSEQFRGKCEQLSGALDAVLGHFCSVSHLFDREELDVIETVRSLDLRPKALLVRIVMRKRQWLRVRHLCRYVEVGDVRSAVGRLCEAGLLDKMSSSVEGSSLDAQLGLLSATELQDLAAAHLRGGGSGGWRGRKKRDVAAALSREGEGDEQIAVAVAQLIGECVSLNAEADRVLQCLQFAYFLDDSQGLERFLLTHHGLCNYPSYELSSSPVFATRDDFVRYQAACAKEQELHQALESNDLEKARALVSTSAQALGFYLEDWSRTSTPSSTASTSTSTEFPKKPSPGLLTESWVHVGIAHRGISLLEKARRYADAIELIQVLLGRPEQPSRRGEWWNRFAIDLEHLGKSETSLEIAETGLADGWVRTGHRLSLQRRVVRLGKPPRRWKTPSFAARVAWQPKEVVFEARPTNSRAGTKSVFVGFDDEDVTVEGLALQYYAREDQGSWTGVHSEGGVWGVIFALLMWDVIFSPVPGAFHHPFQTKPLDLDSDFFYAARREMVDARVAEIERGGWSKLLEATWAREYPRKTLCVGLSWDRYGLDQLQTISRCLGSRGLAAIVRLLAQDHKHWRGGMPDLVLWRTDPEPAAMLVEVKGPRDSLMEKQRAWLMEFEACGVRCEVCRIREP